MSSASVCGEGRPCCKQRLYSYIYCIILGQSVEEEKTKQQQQTNERKQKTNIAEALYLDLEDLKQSQSDRGGGGGGEFKYGETESRTPFVKSLFLFYNRCCK